MRQYLNDLVIPVLQQALEYIQRRPQVVTMQLCRLRQGHWLARRAGTQEAALVQASCGSPDAKA